MKLRALQFGGAFLNALRLWYLHIFFLKWRIIILYVVAVGQCIGTFECLSNCGVCNSNCPYGCCCEYRQENVGKCEICPSGSQCMSTSECISRGGACAANCALGCCCAFGGQIQQPTTTQTATPTWTAPTTTQQPTTQGQFASQFDLSGMMSMLMQFMFMMMFAQMMSSIGGGGGF
jgi:hypothetical protein